MRFDNKKQKHLRAWLLLAVMLLPILGSALTGCGEDPAAPTESTKSEEFTMERDVSPIPEADGLVQTLAADSMVLLKNENSCLPLAKGTKINLFGYNTTEKGFLFAGGGSGGNRAESKNVSLRKAFEDAGVEINTTLYEAYGALDNLDLDNNNAETAPQCVLSNPGADFYTAERMQQAKDFSDTAVVVISRWGRENGKVKDDTGKTHTDIPLVQVKSGMDDDPSRTYLQISTEEELMLQKVKENFDKVIVLINTCNTMELGFLDDSGIDAAMFIGMPGQSGTRAIPKLLFGEVTPSGKTADIYAYNHKADPTWANTRPDYSNSDNKYVAYQEGIYYGYRWYETAFADGIKLNAGGYELDFSTEEGYRDIVQYPFGYGLSYTQFTQEITQAPAAAITAGAAFELKVKVTNTGSVPGKDVVQLYVSAPYTPGGIEKAAVTLLDFAKTDLLQPGESQELTLTFTDYDLAAYDCYDKNGNGFAGYEVEKGEYILKLMKNSHEVLETVTLQAAEEIRISQDPITGETVENRYTGENSYGSAVDGGITYMTRADFAGTFPTQRVDGAKTKAVQNTFDGELKTIQYGQDQGLYLVTLADGSKASASELAGLTNKQLVWNKDLLFKLHDYNNEALWDQFLSQLTKDEVNNLIKEGGFKVCATESLGIYETEESDGPSGVSRMQELHRTGWPASSLTACSWNEGLLYMQGRAVGKSAIDNDIQGWYAPGANLHRSPYTSRNFEYYSEDPILTGKLAAQVIRGAKNQGLTCYLKHFAVSEGGKNPTQVNTWLTEQAMRELYLKAFEIPVKEGKANAVMSAFNNIGDIYCGHNQALLQDILRNEWGFRGAVITDWWGEYMGINQCVMAGNDKMLLKKETQQYVDLMDNSGPSANAARVAVKNIIYSIVDSAVTGGLYEKPLTNQDTLEAADEGGAAGAD